MTTKTKAQLLKELKQARKTTFKQAYQASFRPKTKGTTGIDPMLIKLDALLTGNKAVADKEVAPDENGVPTIDKTLE